MRRRLSSLHPFLVALFPVLSLAAGNAAAVTMPQVWRTAGVSVLGAGALLLLLRPILGSWPRAAVMASLVLIVFFSYGHLRGLSIGGGYLRNRYLLPLVAAVFLAGAIWLRRRRTEPTTLSRGLTLVFSLLVLVSAARIAWSQWKFWEQSPERTASRAAAPAAAAFSDSPDVYYVILDGYAGAQALREVYGFDNSGFLDALRARGFYVADRSRSNYAQTPLSLASSTNMEYIPGELETAGLKTKTLRPLHRMIENSRVMQAFRRRGYRFVSFQSGWNVTGRNRNADWDVNCGGWEEFGRVLAETTMLEAFDFLQPLQMEGSRERLLCQFATLPEIPRRVAAPRYVFAHFVAPQPPLLFGRDGEPYVGKYKELDEGAPGVWKDKPGYVDQLVFCSKRILASIDGIRAASRTPPIIVLQSDHGSAATGFDHLYGNNGLPTTGREPGLDALLRERMEILNAYAVPGGAPALYPSVSPVNSFRVILNARFGESLPLLPDRSYFSRYAHPYAFVDVTDRVKADSGPATAD